MQEWVRAWQNCGAACANRPAFESFSRKIGGGKSSDSSGSSSSSSGSDIQVKCNSCQEACSGDKGRHSEGNLRRWHQAGSRRPCQQRACQALCSRFGLCYITKRVSLTQTCVQRRQGAPQGGELAPLAPGWQPPPLPAEGLSGSPAAHAPSQEHADEASGMELSQVSVAPAEGPAVASTSAAAAGEENGHAGPGLDSPAEVVGSPEAVGFRVRHLQNVRTATLPCHPRGACCCQHLSCSCSGGERACWLWAGLAC